MPYHLNTQLRNGSVPHVHPPRRFAVLLAFLVCSAVSTFAQAPLNIYGDALTNAFEDWGWAPRDFNNGSPVHSGTKSISVTPSAYWQGISFHHADTGMSPYSNFVFWAHGGSTGGQRLQVNAESTVSQPAYSLPVALTANTWQQFSIPLALLGISNAPNFNRVTIQLKDNGTMGQFFVDDIQFSPQPLPSTVNVSINTSQSLRTLNERHFGVNLAIWDPNFDSPYDSTTINLLKEMGCLTVRMPGGSLSDEYHWYSNKSLNNTWEWQTSFSDFIHVNTNVGVQAFVVVNYGTGTPEEAAGWVRHANITNNLGYKYWEIGNECYGDWETDTNVNAHDPFTYARRATNYLAQMRLADPTIKIGVVVAPGEMSYSNVFTAAHPTYNPRTGQTNYGWTPILLAALKSMGVTPDFLIHHHYPQWTDKNNPAGTPDNDVTLLQSTGNWIVQAADLRQQIVDYFGSGGTNIELVVTENNSDAGAQGEQSTSLVDGLYYADSFAQLLKTEFNGFVWWDFRNGSDPYGYFGPSVYGWLTYGDLGMVTDLNTRHPTFYAAKLMQWFARPGDKLLNASSDYGWLTAYAARRSSGAVTLLVLNKSLTTSLNSQIAVNGFTPFAATTVRSFGVANDEATRTNGPAAAKDITTNNLAIAGASFGYNFPPLSMTLFTLAPTAPSLIPLPTQKPGGQANTFFVFQLQGQPDVRYVIQSSTDLHNWVSVSTNTLTGTSLTVSNVLSFGTPAKYWRAVWQP